jgi:hypothetical protein
MLSFFYVRNFRNFKAKAIYIYISVDFAVICNFLFVNQLSSVIHVKKSGVENIGPRGIIYRLFSVIYGTQLSRK